MLPKYLKDSTSYIEPLWMGCQHAIGGHLHPLTYFGLGSIDAHGHTRGLEINHLQHLHQLLNIHVEQNHVIYM